MEPDAQPQRFVDTDLHGARFDGVDLHGARFRNVNLEGVKMVDAYLVNADLSGLIIGLKVNGIEVLPLVDAELNRLHPERTALFARDVAGLREGLGSVERMWAATVQRARALPEEALHHRVDEEWSFVETLRHLIFVTDAWVGRAVSGEAAPYHPVGLPPSFLTDTDGLGLDLDARPSLDEVLAVREQRAATLRALLDGLADDDLEREGPTLDVAGYPPHGGHQVGECIRGVLDEEWAHHQYAIRDLEVLEQE